MHLSTVTLPTLPAPSWPRARPAAAPARSFTIRTAQGEQRAAAGQLLDRRYQWRGYGTVQMPCDQTGQRSTLTAQVGDQLIGTLTLELDGPQGLAADAAFGPELSALRHSGQRLVEFTRLAVQTDETGSLAVLAALFHVGYIVAYRVRRHDVLVLEVNPRHVRFYQRMLGCRVLASGRQHPGTQAPAVLLAVDFAFIRHQIGAFGAQPEHAAESRSLYPFAFSRDDEAGIIGRLLRAQNTRATPPN